MKRKALILLSILILLPVIFLASKGIERLKIVLTQRSVSSVAPRVMEEVSSQGQISIDSKRNALIVVDNALNLERIKNLIGELDVPPRTFALSSTLSIYAPKKESIFKKDEEFIDVDDLMNLSKVSEKYEGIIDIKEGSKGKIEFKPSPFSLMVEIGGYDPTVRKLYFENIELSKASKDAVETLFKGKANLKEGVETTISVSKKSSTPPFRIGVSPTLLPEIKQEKEHP